MQAVQTADSNRLPLKQVTSLGQVFKLPDFEEFRRQSQARFDEIAPAICEKYGLDKEKDGVLIRMIDEAQREIAECANCQGEPCQKRRQKYWVPQIKPDGRGSWYTPGARCKIGQLRCLKTLSGKCKIPALYTTMTFDDYLITPDNKRAVKIAKWFVAEKPQKSLYFYGECGTGKTFLASLISKNFVLDRKDVIFGDVPSLLEEIKRTFNNPTQNSGAILDRYCDCDLLVLDDLGAGQITQWNVGIIYQIVNARYGANKPTIITSNFDLEGLEAKLAQADDLSAKRIVSRLSEMCVLGFLGTKDRRRQS